MLLGRKSSCFVCLFVGLSISVSALLAQQPTTKKAPAKKATTKKTAPAKKAPQGKASGTAKKTGSTTTKYKEYPPKPFKDDRAQKDHEKKVLAILKGQLPLDATGKADLDRWYREGKLLELTTFANISRLPALREELLKSFRRAEAGPGDYAKGRILERLHKFSQAGSLHPAVRYNSMLLIGEMNDIEYGARDARGRAAAIPDPMQLALDTMVLEFRSTTQLDAVRIAAQIGILRHAKLDHARTANRKLDAQKRDAIVGYMFAVVTTKPPAGRTPEGHTWMQRRAIEIMAAFDAVGRSARITSTLEDIVADDTAPTSLRCSAAEALARWLPDSKIKYKAQTPSNLARIGAQAFQNELALVMKIRQQDGLKAQIRALIGDKSGGGSAATTMGDGGGDTDGGMDFSQFMEQSQSQGGGGLATAGDEGSEADIPAGPLDPRVTRSCRRLKYQLACIRAGLIGMGDITALEPQKPAIDNVVAAIDQAYEKTNPAGDLSDLERSIKAGLLALNDYLPEDTSIEETLGAEVPGEPGIPTAPGEPGTPTAAPAEPGTPTATAPGEPGAATKGPGEPAAAEAPPAKAGESVAPKAPAAPGEPAAAGEPPPPGA